MGKKTDCLFLTGTVILLLSGCSVFQQMDSAERQKTAPQCKVYQVPFDYERGWILVKARLNGSLEECVFVLDTGSTITGISRRLLNKIGFQDLGQRTIAIDITGAASKVPYGRIDSVNMGEAEFKDIEAAGIDTDRISHDLCERIDGFIASNMFKDWILQIDYRYQMITFAERKECLPAIEGSYHTEFLFSDDGSTPPRCWCVFNGTLKKLIFLDTGNPGSIVIPSYMFKETGQTTDGEEGMKAWGRRQVGIFGTIREEQYTNVDTIEIGNLKMEDVPVIVGEYAHSTLGNGFFQGFLVQLDYPRREIIFAPYANVRLNSHPSFFGFLWSYEKGKATVDWLYDNSPASEGGIEIGDEIMSINGQQITPHISHERLCDIKRSLGSADTLELVLKREGTIIDASIKKR